MKVLPYLSPDEGHRILAALGESSCLTRFYLGQEQWPSLLQNVADRNPKGFGDAAEILLTNGQGATKVRAKYLLGMAMLGHIGAGEPERAQAVWEKFSKQVFGDEPAGMVFEIMLARLRKHAPT